MIILAEPIDPDVVAPTIGFRNVKFTFDNYEITVSDSGGGTSHCVEELLSRGVWRDLHGGFKHS